MADNEIEVVPILTCFNDMLPYCMGIVKRLVSQSSFDGHHWNMPCKILSVNSDPCIGKFFYLLSCNIANNTVHHCGFIYDLDAGDAWIQDPRRRRYVAPGVVLKLAVPLLGSPHCSFKMLETEYAAILSNIKVGWREAPTSQFSPAFYAHNLRLDYYYAYVKKSNLRWEENMMKFLLRRMGMNETQATVFSTVMSSNCEKVIVLCIDKTQMAIFRRLFWDITKPAQ